MPAVARQQYLQFGPEEQYELLHGRHNEQVCVAYGTADSRGFNDHRVVDHDLALLRAMGLIQDPANNVYISQSGVKGRRVTQCVSAIPALWVDLDVYNLDELSGIGRDELLDRIAAAFPWLPIPTMTIASGRGYYLVWAFTEALSREHLPKWQAVEDALTQLLSPFAADPACKDATRLLRVVGGTNTKSGAVVSGYRTGGFISFATLERVVLSNALPVIAKPRIVTPELRLIPGAQIPLPEIERLSKSTPAQRRQRIQGYQLAHDRMHDCEMLACLRGSPRVQDYRSRLLYVYAVAGAWYCSSREELEQSLKYFAEQHFEDAHRYSVRQVGTVLDRMEQGKQGVRQIWQGEEVNRRYRLTNSTIIANLDITPDEQTQLRTLIGPQERQKRRVGRRRAAGMVDYGKRTADRLATVERMLNEGYRQKEIATHLGISPAAVCKLAQRLPSREINQMVYVLGEPLPLKG